MGVSIDKLFFELGIDPTGMRTGAAKAQGIFGNISKRAKITLGVLGGFTVLFTAIGVKSAAAASKFQDAFNEVRTLIDETEVDSKALREEVLKLAATVGRPPSEVSRGLYQVISAGVTDAAEAMDVLEIATRASIGGLTDQFTAVDAVTTVLNAYNLEASEAEHVTDLMLNAVKEGKLTFGTLASTIGQVVSTAALANVSFEEISAAMATMTKSGLSAEIAVTALNNLLLRIINPQEDAAIAAREFGIELSATALKVKGLGGVMIDFQKGIGGSIDKLVKVLPEIRGMRGAAILAGTGFEEFNRILETTKDVVGTTDEFFRKIKQSASEAARELSTRLLVQFIALGEKILPVVNAGLRAMVDFIDAITKSDFEKLADQIKELGGAQELAAQLLIQQRILDSVEKRVELSAQLAAIQKNASLSIGVGFARMNKGLLEFARLIRNVSLETDGLIKLEKTRTRIARERGNVLKALAEDTIAGNKEGIKQGKNSLIQLDLRIAAMTKIINLLSGIADEDKKVAKFKASLLELELDTQKKISKEKKDQEAESERFFNRENLNLKIALKQLATQEGIGAALRARTDAAQDIAQEIGITLEIRGAARATQQLGRVGRELDLLSDRSALAVDRTGQLVSAIADVTRIEKDSISTLGRVAIGVGLFGAAISVFSAILDRGSKAAERLAKREKRLREERERSAKQIELTLLLAQRTAAQRLEIFFSSLAQGLKNFGFVKDGNIQIAALVGALQREGLEGTTEQVGQLATFIQTIFAAIEDGIITPAEAQKLQDVITRIARLNPELIPVLEAFFSGSDTLSDIFNLLLSITGGLGDLGDSLNDLLPPLKQLADQTERWGRILKEVSENFFLRPFADLRRRAPLQPDRPPFLRRAPLQPDRPPGIAAGTTTDFRQFVGITEVQGNALLGILNTSMEIQRDQLQIMQQNVLGIGVGAGISIENFELEVNFNAEVNLDSDRGIRNTGEILANEAIRALRAVGVE